MAVISPALPGSLTILIVTTPATGTAYIGRITTAVLPMSLNKRYWQTSSTETTAWVLRWAITIMTATPTFTSRILERISFTTITGTEPLRTLQRKPELRQAAGRLPQDFLTMTTMASWTYS